MELQTNPAHFRWKTRSRQQHIFTYIHETNAGKIQSQGHRFWIQMSSIIAQVDTWRAHRSFVGAVFGMISPQSNS